MEDIPHPLRREKRKRSEKGRREEIEERETQISECKRLILEERRLISDGNLSELLTSPSLGRFS